jgi:serine/threonine protein kinase/tetratricopeptide (TPR) repeat protein
MPADSAAVKALFLEAAAIDDPVARAAFVNERCGEDAALRDRVLALLVANDRAVAHEGTASFGGADGPRGTTTADFHGKDEHVGAILAGKYKLVQAIGEGGMGSVFMAQQTEPVKRAVAVKVVKAGMDSRAVLARFEAERQALAVMDHPNIAKVLDAGTTDGGRPFFVMELVKGTPITRYCDEHRLNPRQRLELFVPVCQAIQHAHQKGIIHRDIKPSNVLVAMYDDRPVPKVIDFGVAKDAGQSLTDKTLMTGFGALVGTPEYMSPEQANLNNLDIDTRSDVYSLGVLLYELLTGTTPVDKKSLGKAAVLEILRIVREVEAPRPSAKLSTIDTLPSVAANRGTEPARLSRLMKGELDWLVLRALEKDRTRRYETANALARDIQRYLADEVVEARPPSPGYRLRKFVRRHPLELALAGMAAVLLAGGVAVGWWQHEQSSARRQTDLRRQLEDEKRLAADGARLGRNAEAVAALLGQCEEALKAGELARAAVALEAARKRSDEGGAENDAGRIGRLDADLALVRELDRIDQFSWVMAHGRFPDPAAVATRTREALARFGADPEAELADDAAARVSASVVLERIVSVLDRELSERGTARTHALLRHVDSDPYRDAFRDAVLARDRQKVVELAARAQALEQPAGFVAFLGYCPLIAVERRRELLRAALSRWPGNLDLLMGLAHTSPDGEGGLNEQVRWYQAAVAAAPANYVTHYNLGNALADKGQADEAIACYKKAVALDPKLPHAHLNLGSLLCDAKGDYDGAIACYQKALAIVPRDALAQTDLGVALFRKGQVDEAIACIRKAIDFDPKLAGAHEHLGLALKDKGQLDEAIACFKKAIALDPKLAAGHANLGAALAVKGRVDEAIVCWKKAIELDPKLALAHTGLGLVLRDKGQVDEAIACFKKAIELDPNLALARTKLAKAERLAAARDKLPAFQNGSYTLASNDERLGLVEWCQIKKLPHTASRLYAAAFAADPKLADDLGAGHRYNAACFAALAAAGRGEDASMLDDKERARLRRQALDWLRAELAMRASQREGGQTADRAAAQKALLHWQEDADLAGLRDKQALAKLSAQEQKAFAQLCSRTADEGGSDSMTTFGISGLKRSDE